MDFKVNGKFSIENDMHTYARVKGKKEKSRYTTNANDSIY